MRHDVRIAAAALLTIPLWAGGCQSGEAGESGDRLDMLAPELSPDALAGRVQQFAPAAIGFDDAGLAAWERQVLARLIDASAVMHEIFAVQVSPRHPEWKRRLQDGAGPGKQAARTYFDIMVGPWDRLQHNEPFLDVGPKPPGAGYYPEDLTADEFDAWLEAHPEQRADFTSPFTLIRREGDSLVAVPYSDAYRPRLERAASLLQEAADLSRNESLSRYLRARADAFLSNDYYESDMAWMDIRGSRIEPTIGPYEVYEDELLGLKAAFESFVTVADSSASADLDRLKDNLRMLEGRLPIEDRHKNVDRGFESPMRVVDVAYTAGDARAGVQTIAFNLPNDERVREAKGSKKVMLRNVSRAKFQRILVPIAERVLDERLLRLVNFQPWFTGVVMHELAHGLGPGYITTAGGERITVNQALRDRYSALEEAKADVVGLHSLGVLHDEGLYDDAFIRRAYVSKLPDMFRGIRFGAGEAHGKANLVQFNWHLEQGALAYDAASGKFSANVARMAISNRALAQRILEIQATGDYDAAGRLLDQYGIMTAELQQAVDGLASVPVDIRPEYTR